jgi:hypothetical protein
VPCYCRERREGADSEVDDWLLERLLTFDVGAEDHEHNGYGEPEDDAEVDRRPSGH